MFDDNFWDPPDYRPKQHPVPPPASAQRPQPIRHVYPPQEMIPHTDSPAWPSSASMWWEACKLAWRDPAGGRITAMFTRTVLKLSPVIVGDDVLTPLTFGLAAPVTVGDNLVLVLGGAIFFSKVRRYRREIEHGYR